MHTVLAEVIFFERVVEWSFDCANFLEKSTRELSKSLLPENRRGLVRENRVMLESIEYLAATGKSMLGFQRSSKERVQSQIGVVGRAFSHDASELSLTACKAVLFHCSN